MLRAERLSNRTAFGYATGCLWNTEPCGTTWDVDAIDIDLRSYLYYQLLEARQVPVRELLQCDISERELVSGVVSLRCRSSALGVLVIPARRGGIEVLARLQQHYLRFISSGCLKAARYSGKGFSTGWGVSGSNAYKARHIRALYARVGWFVDKVGLYANFKILKTMWGSQGSENDVRYFSSSTWLGERIRAIKRWGLVNISLTPGLY